MKPQMTSRERVMTALNLGQPDRVPWVESYVQPSFINNILGRTVKPRRGERWSGEVREKLCLDNTSCNFSAPVYAQMERHGDQEMIRTPWLKTWEDLEKLKKWLPDNKSKAYYADAEDFLKTCKSENYANIAVIKVGLANTYNSMGYEDFIYNLADEPEFVQACLEAWGDWCSTIIDRVNEMDFDLYWFPEDVAFQTGPMVTMKQYEEYIFPFCKKILSKAAKPFIYHSDGDYTALLDHVLQYNPKGIANLEPPYTDIYKLKETYGHKVCLVGNIDLHYTLTMGTPEETTAEVKEKLERVGKGGGYIIASANSLTSYCKSENVQAMSDAIMKYGWYK